MHKQPIHPQLHTGFAGRRVMLRRYCLRSASALGLCFALCLPFAGIQPVFVHADTSDEYQNANDNLDQLRKQEADLSGDLTELSDQLNASASQLASLEQQIEDKDQEISSLQTELQQISSDKQEQYSAMRLRIRYMYESNTSNSIDVLLGSSDFSEFLNRASYIQEITNYDRRMLQQLNDLFVKESTDQTQLESDRNALVSLRNDIANQQTDLQNLITSKQSQLQASSALTSQAEALALEYEAKLQAEKDAAEEAGSSSGFASLADATAASSSAASATTGSTTASADSGSSSDSGSTTPAADPGNSGSGSSSGNSGTSNNSGNSGNSGNSTDPGSTTSATDLAMLAAIIECEAGNQPYEGRLAVGSVVMNRVDSPYFPNSISAVLYQSGQFVPVASGRFAIVLARGACATCTQAAQDVLNGTRNVSYLYFHTNRASDASRTGISIGDHFFY